jgi:hypothetical protein
MKNVKVTEYIEKQHSPQKEICQQLRTLIFKTIPTINEEMKWGVPTYADGKFYIVALQNHVNLGFSLKGLSKEEEKLFQGSGKTMKHLEICSLNDINERKITQLILLVIKKR